MEKIDVVLLYEFMLIFFVFGFERVEWVMVFVGVVYVRFREFFERNG